MKKKSLKRRAVYVAYKGSVKVPVYVRLQTKCGRQYVSFVAADYSKGRRKLWTFSNPEHAKAKANEIASAIATGETTGTEWTSELRIEIREALEISKAMGIGLLQAMTVIREAVQLLNGRHDNILAACQAWKKSAAAQTLAPIRVELAKKEYMARQTKISERRKRTMRSFLTTFDRHFVGRMLHEVTTVELKDMADSKKWAPKSYNDFLAGVSLLFLEGQLRRWVPPYYNPAREIKRLKMKGSTIGIFQPFEARQMLARVDSDLKPFIAVWCFSGCRKEEASRLSWSQVNRGLETGFIELNAEQTKTGNSRLVPIEPNLRLWLMAHRKDAGPLLPARWQGMQRLDDLPRYLSRKTQVVWQDNACRHSYASFHFKMYKDAAATVDSMGTSLSKLEKHYRSRDKLISDEMAREWFNITPDSAAALLTIPDAAAA